MAGSGEIRAVTRVLMLRPGLYLLRYVSAEDLRYPPRVLIHVDPDSAKAITFQPVPGRDDTQLRAPGEVVIAAVEALARVLVTTLRDSSGLSDTITLKVDRLDLAEAKAQPLTALPSAVAKNQNVPEAGLRVSAYVDQLGDVVVEGPKWIGSESGSTQISGLSLHWPHRPNSVDIEYAVSLLGQGRGPNVTTDGYAGARGQGRPINGAFLNLIGPQAHEYQLHVSAVFSDGTRRNVQDRRVQLLGPTGREYLCAIMINLTRQENSGSVALNNSSIASEADDQSWNGRSLNDDGRLQIHRPTRKFHA